MSSALLNLPLDVAQLILDASAVVDSKSLVRLALVSRDVRRWYGSFDLNLCLFTFVQERANPLPESVSAQ